MPRVLPSIGVLATAAACTAPAAPGRAPARTAPAATAGRDADDGADGGPMLAAASTTALGPGAAQAPTAPAAPPYAGPLPIRIDWGNDYALSVGFRDEAGVYEPGAPDALAALVLRMERAGGVVWQREGFAAISGLAAPPPPLGDGCEYRLGLEKLAWSDGTGARLGVTCVASGDSYSARELAILLDLPDPAAEPFPIWAGEGDAHSDSDGACLRRRTVGFRLAKTALTQIIVEEAEAPGPGKTCKPAYPRKKPKLTTTRRTLKLEVPRAPKLEVPRAPKLEVPRAPKP